MKTQEEIEQLAEEKYKNNLHNPYFRAIFMGFIEGYKQCQSDMLHDQTVTRFEVIDENGRVYSQWSCKIELSYQDDGRTLKVFIKK